MHNSKCFTFTSHAGRMRSLQSTCTVSEAYNPTAMLPLPDANNYMALWDTGATASVINQKVVDDLGLQPIGMTQVHGVGGLHDSELYLVAIELPNSIRLPAIQVTKGNLGPTLDVLIGMDIITLGDFSVTNKDGNTLFSFRMPGLVHTDYVAEHRDASEREALRLQRLAANQKVDAERLAKAEAKRIRKQR